MKKTLCAIFLLAAAGAAFANDPLTKSIQQKLKDEGFYYGAVDGQSGEETSAALKRYQIRNGLPVTGQADLDTVKALGVGGKPSYTENKGPAVIKDSYAPDRSTPPSQSSPPPSSYYPPQSGQMQPPPQQPAYSPSQPSYQSGYYAAPPQPLVALSKIFVATPYETAPPELQQEILRRAQYILSRRGYYRGELDGLPGNMTASAIGQFQRERRLANTYRMDMGTLAEMGLLPRRVPPPPNWNGGNAWNSGVRYGDVWGR